MGLAASAAEADRRIEQATYNIFSDMGVAAGDARTSITLDPGGSNHAPERAASRSAPNPAKPTRPVTFNASASNDPDGTIAKYEWDLDGNGSYRDQHRHEPDRRRTATRPRATIDVRLRVTDNGGATDLAVRDR